MITIEDLFEELESIATGHGYQNYHSGNIIASPADRRFISELCQRTKSGGCFSTKQAMIAQKIIRKYAHLFDDAKLNTKQHLTLSADDILAICDSPIFRNVPYQSSDIPREVRHLGKRKLGFKCKFAPQIIDRIKALKDPIADPKTPWPKFNKKHKIWVVEVTENNLDKIMSIIKKFNFQFDDEVVQFLTNCENAKSNISSGTLTTDHIQITIQHNLLLSNWMDNILLQDINLDV